MLVTKIQLVPTDFLDQIDDIEDNNVDVFVDLEDGSNYTVVVITAKNLVSLMNKDKMNFTQPGQSFIIVRKLTQEIIEEAIQAYAEDDAYWLKSYHFAGDVDINVFHKLQAEYIESRKELDEFENS